MSQNININIFYAFYQKTNDKIIKKLNKKMARPLVVIKKVIKNGTDTVAYLNLQYEGYIFPDAIDVFLSPINSATDGNNQIRDIAITLFKDFSKNVLEFNRAQIDVLGGFV